MTECSEQSRWDARYEKAESLGNVNALLIESSPMLPSSGRALDIAGGSGADALFLAGLGLDTTLADLSPKALAMAQDASVKAGLALRTMAVNTEVDPLPDGPWDLVHIGHYLHRPTIAGAISQLRPGGLLVIAIATMVNLERRARPSARFLLKPGELRSLVGGRQVNGLEVGGLEILRSDEEWRENGIHEAWLIARR